LNEPGEGSGVARAFYTALAEAILIKQKLPNLGPAQVTFDNSKYLVLLEIEKAPRFKVRNQCSLL
jgi:E3 ubiquitin-protein ligase EDD1